MIRHIATAGSTNDEARDPQLAHGDVVWADEQTAGRGQRGHAWSSTPGENLTFSVVLRPTFLPAGEQFLFSEAVTLALVRTFGDYGIDTRIKWTNDIYAGDRKLVGILIEHHYAGATLDRTVAGIGINVNQRTFDPSLPNPVSMAQLTGRTYDRREVLEAFLAHLHEEYGRLEAGDAPRLQDDYRARMYRLGECHPYRLADGTAVEAAIEGVRPSGELLLRHDDGTLRAYLFREVEFVIAGR